MKYFFTKKGAIDLFREEASDYFLKRLYAAIIIIIGMFTLETYFLIFPIFSFLGVIFYLAVDIPEVYRTYKRYIEYGENQHLYIDNGKLISTGKSNAEMSLNLSKINKIEFKLVDECVVRIVLTFDEGCYRYEGYEKMNDLLVELENATSIKATNNNEIK